MTYVILDSCNSEGFIKAKGGRLTPPFLLDEANIYEGFVYLTSSRETEKSYESENIGGSLFTSALASGLRGAADTNGDESVTLLELSTFLEDETPRLAENENIYIQEPVIKMNMQQSGKIIITDLKETGSSLHLGENITGNIVIIDTSGNRYLRFYKSYGKERHICLAPGQYKVRIHHNKKYYIKAVKLKNGETYTLSSHNNMKIFREAALPAKGKSPGLYTSLGFGAGPCIPLGDTRELTGTGVSQITTCYLMFPGKTKDFGIGILTGFQYEATAPDYPISYTRNTVPASLCAKVILSPQSFYIDFFIEASAGIMGISQTNQENIVSRLLLTGSMGIDIPINRHITLEGHCRISVSPFDDASGLFDIFHSDYFYTNFSPCLLLTYNINKKE